jgi:uncharacterized membrane protein
MLDAFWITILWALLATLFGVVGFGAFAEKVSVLQD